MLDNWNKSFSVIQSLVAAFIEGAHMLTRGYWQLDETSSSTNLEPIAQTNLRHSLIKRFLGRFFNNAFEQTLLG